MDDNQEKSVPTGMMPTCWGQSLWLFLHSIAFIYNPSVDRAKYYEFFIGLGNILPCEECRNHYYENLDENKLLNALNSNEDFFRYVYDLHNTVNKKLDVPEDKWPSYETVKNKYSSFEASCEEIPGVCKPGNKNGIKKIKTVEDTPINDENIYFIYSTLILSILLVISFYYIYRLKSIKK